MRRVIDFLSCGVSLRTLIPVGIDGHQKSVY
jgi:hypothetical protein